MIQQDLWLVRQVGALPAGTRGTGRKWDERCAFSPLGSTAIYRIPSAWVTDVEPPPPDVITPRLVEMGQRYAPLGLLALGALLLTGCDHVTYGYGVLTGVFLAVLTAAAAVAIEARRARKLDIRPAVRRVWPTSTP